jgi:hypothetical protein
MFRRLYRHFITSIIFLSLVSFAGAQQIHFVYIQTEGEQPFYIKMDQKIISSSTAGYLILPKLQDGNYDLSIGYPKNEFPEENFQINVEGKNEGFLLKNFGDKGWGLFNLENYQVTMGATEARTNNVQKNIRADPFSKMLATVVKDSTILQRTSTVPDTLVAVRTDSLSIRKASDTSNQGNAMPALLTRNEVSGGVQMTYMVPEEKSTDTVQVLFASAKQNSPIDSTNKVSAQAENIRSIPNKQDTTSLIPASDTSIQKQQPDSTQHLVFLSQITTSAKKDTANSNVIPAKADSSILSSNMNTLVQPIISKTDSASKVEEKRVDSLTEANVDNKTLAKNALQAQVGNSPAVVNSSTVNSDCKAFADNDDFLKLRKRMASENSVEKMIDVAKKAFKSKCFSTVQIKNLSYLFLTDKSRYNFFDAAYAYASDSDLYYTLQSQLTDPYYVNRFKAMIHK